MTAPSRYGPNSEEVEQFIEWLCTIDEGELLKRLSKNVPQVLSKNRVYQKTMMLTAVGTDLHFAYFFAIKDAREALANRVSALLDDKTWTTYVTALVATVRAMVTRGSLTDEEYQNQVRFFKEVGKK